MSKPQHVGGYIHEYIEAVVFNTVGPDGKKGLFLFLGGTERDIYTVCNALEEQGFIKGTRDKKRGGIRLPGEDVLELSLGGIKRRLLGPKETLHGVRIKKEAKGKNFFDIYGKDLMPDPLLMTHERIKDILGPNPGFTFPDVAHNIYRGRRL